MKKILFSILCSLMVLMVFSQQHSLVKVWETDSLMEVPESVLPDYKNKVLYVSNINGKDAWGKNRGSIGKVGLDGKIILVEWVGGLHAPKGMGLYKNNLYVADLTRVITIDVTSGKITSSVEVEGAQFLNDVTVDSKGNVYISDSST